MKSFIVLVGVLLLLCSCGRQDVKSSSLPNDLENQGLKGNVKSIKVFTYEAVPQSGGTQRKTLKNKTTTLLNSGGYITETSEEGSGGKLRSKTTVKYDGTGNKFEEIENNPDGKMISKASYKYDKAGNPVGKSSCDFDGRGRPNNVRNFTYEYDSSGNMIENSVSTDGSLDYKNVCQYDAQGNLIESSSYGKDGKLLQKKIFNDAGYLAESHQMYISKDGNSTSKITYKYDDKSPKPGKVTFWNMNKAESAPVETCSGKADGTVVKMMTAKNSYDDKGNLLETSASNADGKLISKETTSYDKAGNWLKKTISSQNVKGSVIIVREIEYY